MFAVVVKSSDLTTPSFLGGFVGAMTRDGTLSSQLQVHAIRYLREHNHPTKVKDFPLPKNPSRKVQCPLFIHIFDDVTQNTPRERSMFATNIAEALRQYSAKHFQYESCFEVGADQTILDKQTQSDCIGNYLTFDDTMYLMKQNIFRGHVIAIVEDEILMNSYFGAAGTPAAREYFREIPYLPMSDCASDVVKKLLLEDFT
jgi:hypothetical protein